MKDRWTSFLSFLFAIGDPFVNFIKSRIGCLSGLAVIIDKKIKGF